MKFKIVFFQDGQSVVIYCDIIMSQRNIRSSSRQPSNFLLEWLIDVKNINIFKNNFHKTYIFPSEAMKLKIKNSSIF